MSSIGHATRKPVLSHLNKGSGATQAKRYGQTNLQTTLSLSARSDGEVLRSAAIRKVRMLAIKRMIIWRLSGADSRKLVFRFTKPGSRLPLVGLYAASELV